MSHLLPSTATFSVSSVWLKGLLMTVFPLHLMLMNAVLGTTLLSILTRFCRDGRAPELSRVLARTVPLLLAFAVNLGVASLLFIQVIYGRFFYVSSILMAVFWLGVIPLLIIAYYLLYLQEFRKARGGSAWLISAGAFLILLSIAFIYCNNMTLMLVPDRWSAYFDNSSGTILNLSDAALLPRYLHFTVGGVAVGGLFVALIGAFSQRHGKDWGSLAVSMGMKTFLRCTTAQLLIGLWLLQSLPAQIGRSLMGGQASATVLFMAAMLLAMGAMMAASLRGVYFCTALVIPLVYVMVFVRDHVRSSYLAPYPNPAITAAEPQYQPLALFFCTLAIGLTLMVWMVSRLGQATDD